MSKNEERDRTISDFGRQWTEFTENAGYYGSGELFADLVEPLVSPSAFAGRAVADIGSGTGRIVHMLHAAGASRIVAVEPSAAMEELRENTRDFATSVEYLEVRGDELPANAELDWVVAFGVLHHIPDPAPVVEAAHRALRSGGRILVWLYGREGNQLYLALAQPARMITRRLPHWALNALARTLEPLLSTYAWLCRWIPLPMASYMRDHISHLSRDVRTLTIYDQLNPGYAKYYRRDEALALLTSGGFADVECHHRHGYSWTVVGTKAATPEVPEAE